MEKLEEVKKFINYYVKVLSNASSSTVRARDHRELGYGKFYFEDKITHWIKNENHEEGDYIDLRLYFRQEGYKEHCIVRKKYIADNLDNIKDFYKQFLDELILYSIFMKTNTYSSNFKNLYNEEGIRIQYYSFADLINKELEEKIDG